MDAITLLKNDHQKVRQLLSQLTEEESADKRQTLLDQIAVELEAHTAIEEEIFYPAFRKAGDQHDDEKMYFEAMEEHRAAGDLVLPDLKGTQPDSEKFGGRAKVLKELIEHHAEEEEKEMFPRARKVLGADRLEELGARMEARKQELLSALKH
jgi:hemerythrin superfamily protein